MKEEIWKDIPGYEGRYKINHNGDVFSYLSSKILSPKIEKTGYKFINMSKLGEKFKCKRIHRLMAITYLENPLKEVNHINGIKGDNRLENLEWITPSGNQRHRYDVLKQHGPNLGKFGIKHWCSKKIIQLTKDNKFIKEWNCGLDITRELGIDNSGISACCNGKLKSSGGYIWKLKN